MATADEELTFAGGTLSFGGTDLGNMQSVTLVRSGVVEAVSAEEYGGESVQLILLREIWTVAAILIDWNSDALEAATLNHSSGVVTYPGTVAPGTDLETLAQSLVLTARDTNHPGFTLYHAVPIPEASELVFSGRQELSLQCAWVGMRDSSDRVVRIA
jgi:hypothetical protein